MPVKIFCPHCATSYSLAETQIGKKVRCKHCSEGFVVADPSERPRSRDDDYDDDRDEPRRPRRKKKGMPTGLLIGLGIGVFVLLLGCLGGGGVLLWLYGPFGNKVTQENYNKINTGMTEAEVKAILGEPTESRPTQGNVHALVWHRKSARGGASVQIVFQNGKVMMKQGVFMNAP
ncbi:MAG TPA: outer membrane protein assembly factor BamE [Gemmataceae bacterium]|nr:outer membrane protein assembly factor BamE [Gemmataceae bacterium]